MRYTHAFHSTVIAVQDCQALMQHVEYGKQ